MKVVTKAGRCGVRSPAPGLLVMEWNRVTKRVRCAFARAGTFCDFIFIASLRGEPLKR